ncbi:MAG TPA: hypothetical protein VN969_39285 [Streptosporangiaceae bacterium]|jgi:hypothetical protein|nr:hypothetical protein [Streptosporangiaceae bacterium]
MSKDYAAIPAAGSRFSGEQQGLAITLTVLSAGQRFRLRADG